MTSGVKNSVLEPLRPGGGTQYIFGWGGAARPLIPRPCLRQKIAYFPTLFKTEFRFLIPCSGLKITAGQRTMSGLIEGLTGQTFDLPVMLTGQN